MAKHSSEMSHGENLKKFVSLVVYIYELAQINHFMRYILLIALSLMFACRIEPPKLTL